LFCSVLSMGQDGSDIKYFETKAIDSTFIGKSVHIDFYNNSFAARKIDTVEIIVNNRPIKFIEHRQDDGLNNWFSRQCLTAMNYNEQEQLKIVKAVIIRVTEDSILVSNYFELHNKKNEPLPGKSFIQENWVDKKIISMVLVKSESCCK